MSNKQDVDKALELLTLAESGDGRSVAILDKAWRKFFAELKDLPELQGAFEQMGKQSGFLSPSLCLRAFISERSAKGWWAHAAKVHVATWLFEGTTGTQASNEAELEDIEIEIEEMFGLQRFSRIQREILAILATSN